MSPAKLVDIVPTDAAGARARHLSVPEGRATEILFRILEANGLCSIATVSPDNRAHTNTAYFCYSQALELYFLSHPGSTHCRNLLSNASLAMTVFASSQRWTDPGVGLQLFGNAFEAKGQMSLEAERLYAKRFPAYHEWRKNLKTGDLAVEYRFYQFLPEHAKILDEQVLGDGIFIRGLIWRQTT